MNCVWNRNVIRVLLLFANRVDLCIFTLFQVYDGGSVQSPLLGRFCGAQIPAPVSSTQNMMTVKFVTDGSQHNTGFMASYTSSSAGACNSHTQLIDIFVVVCFHIENKNRICLHITHYAMCQHTTSIILLTLLLFCTITRRGISSALLSMTNTWLYINMSYRAERIRYPCASRKGIIVIMVKTKTITYNVYTSSETSLISYWLFCILIKTFWLHIIISLEELSITLVM